jgi:hypothetical protein
MNQKVQATDSQQSCIECRKERCFSNVNNTVITYYSVAVVSKNYIINSHTSLDLMCFLR